MMNWTLLICSLVGLGWIWLIIQELTKLMAKVSQLTELLAPIKTTLEGVAASQTQISEQLAKATKEIVDALNRADVDIPQDALDAIASINSLATGLQTSSTTLKDEAQKLDDLNPDVPPPTT